MKTPHTLIILLIMTLVCACGDSDKFRIHGQLTDDAAINLRIVYYTDGAVFTGITASNAGKFVFEGRSPRGDAMVELYDNDYRLLGRVMARNGEDVELHIDRSNRYHNTAAGNDIAGEWTDCLNSMADVLRDADADTRNAAVSEYIKANPSSAVSYLLLLTEFDASDHVTEAAALDSLITDEARIRGISVGFEQQIAHVSAGMSLQPVLPIPYRVSGTRSSEFNASDAALTLLAFSDSRCEHDSIVELMRDLAGSERKGRFMLLDLNLDTDTATWRRTTRNDSASWTQGWVAGTRSLHPVERLAMTSLPYFILVDSAGRQLWRGSSAAEARINTRQFMPK